MGDTMEIGTYLRALGWRAVLASLVVVAAVGGPTAYVLRRPAQYRAVAAVRVPAVAPEGGAAPQSEADEGAQSSQLAADLGAILGLSSTKTALAAETGVSVRALEQGLSATRAGSDQYVDISFRDTARARARQVARAAALRALTILTGERMVATRHILDAAEQRLAEVEVEGSVERPLTVYRRARADESRLERLVLGQLAAGDPVGAESARRSLDEARRISAEAAQQLLPFQHAAADGEAAQQAVAEARLQFVRLDERNKSILAARAVANGPVRREVPVKELASAAVGGAVAAGILLFGWVTTTEVRSVLRRRRRPAW